MGIIYDQPVVLHTDAGPSSAWVAYDRFENLSYATCLRRPIVDEWDALGPGMKIDRRATDWGLASLGINGAFLIMAPVMLFFNDFYSCVGINHAHRTEIDGARIATVAIGIMFLGLISFGIFCGFRGLGIARSTQQAVALPLAGILVGFVVFVLWLALGIDLLAVLRVFL